MLNQDGNVVEYVEFRTRPGVSDTEVLTALNRTDIILAEIDGFERRYIARHEEVWVEIVFWRDQQVADFGLEVFKVDSRSAELFGLIEEGSVSIRYANLCS